MPASVFNLPRYQGPDMELRRWSDALIQVLEAQQNQAAAPSGDYTVSNVTASRTFDATAATLAQTRQVVGTMIEDLQAKGTFI